MIKKNIKLLIGIIIGGIVFGSIGVYGAGKLYASSIDVDTSKMSELGETSNVNLALNYLYGKASKVGQCPDGYVCNIATNPGYLPGNDANTYTQSTFVQNLKVGDLIKMTPITSSVRLDGIKSGYRTYITTPTYLNPSELNLWRVIRKNSNGTVDIVSEYVSRQSVLFANIDGYANYIGYLNELASYYENPKYTIGSRHMGYNGQTNYITDISKFDGTTNSTSWASATSASTTSANEALGAGDMMYETDLNLVKLSYGGSANSYSVAYTVGTSTSRVYLLASRYYVYYNSSSFCFNPRYVSTDGSLPYTYFRYYNNGIWHASSKGGALRPILTLKADVTSSDVDNETGAYILS